MDGLVALLACVLSYAVSSVAGSTCTSTPPTHADVECVIWRREDNRCFKHEANGRLINECDDLSACHVSAGIQLEISCGQDGSAQELRKGNVTLGERNVSWPFAEPPEVESGMYECRDSSDGSLVSYRFVIIDEEAYVLPGPPNYDLSCNRDISPDYTPGFDCNLAVAAQRFFGTGTHITWFNVLGVRPIDISIEVVWSNHYPVNLHLSYDTEASNTTSLHSVTLNSDDVVFVGSSDAGTVRVRAYVAITANGINNNSEPSTMCVTHDFLGVPLLFPGEDLPMDQTVTSGTSAEFLCQASTRYDSSDEETVTLAISVGFPGYLEQCTNCTFSATEELSCEGSADERTSCSGLKFSRDSSGSLDNRLIHKLTARWDQVGLELDGYRVACAIAVDGVTQWVNTATLTVLAVLATPTTSPTTPSVTVTAKETNDQNNDLSSGEIAGIVVGGVAIVCVGVLVVVIVGVILVKRRMYKSKGRRLRNNNSDEQRENLEKTDKNLD